MRPLFRSVCLNRYACSNPVLGTSNHFYMKILIIEPYFTGSHKQWAEGYKRHSSHDIKILSIKGQFWKWRMHGGAITLAKMFDAMDWLPDLILATDMLDLNTFLSLTRDKSNGIPTALYFHENQLSYPWSPDDRDIKNKRDSHYGFINYSSALAADRVFFNSKFHMRSFLDALNPFLKQFPDYQELGTIDIIKEKSEVLFLGMDLTRFREYALRKDSRPNILWNHRWEYDKNPKSFFSVLKRVKNESNDFGLVILGENFSKSPKVFEESKKEFKNQIVHWGYLDSFEEYAKWLWKSHIIPVTSNQEFFGGSVMEAIYCGVWPILPNRLTYPELIPKIFHKDNTYNTEEELCKKILWSINNYNDIAQYNIASIPERFDWRLMSIEYDEKLEAIL